jgi:hypothetical protein
MKLVLSRLFSLLLSFVFLNFAANAELAKKPDQSSASRSSVQTMPVNELRPGMRGVAYTVFEGVKPEPMEVEILGVLRNANGPKSDLILVRLRGEKPEYSGVVAGMSGSPVYVDGKLIGALSYRIGEFSKEPIGGVTPIAQMMEIDELDRSLPAESMKPAPARSEVSKTASPGSGPDWVQGYARMLRPIETPLVFNGFSPEALQRFGPQFSALGITPVMGAGSMSDDKQPEPLEPGSAVSAVLVRGDMDIAATCTVTYADADRLLACGHPILQFGGVDIAMNKARVMATLASPLNSFKIVNTTEFAGSFVQDRHTGILGRFGKQPAMIPVKLSVHGGAQPKQFQFEVMNNAKLTPLLVMASVFNSLQGVNEYGEETTFRVNGKIAVSGYPDVAVQNMFPPGDSGAPAALVAALSLGDRFSRVFDNPTSTPEIKGVDLDFELVRDRRTARLETARTDVTEARPGDDIVIEAVLRPYRGERIVRQVPIKVPTSTPKGTLRILVSDGDTLDRMRRLSSSFSRRLDLGSTIALLNKEHANHRLYVSMLENNPQAMVEDKVMPTVPLSVMNVMEGMRGTQDMMVMSESAVSEASTPLDYVVSGSQVISITIK